MVSFKNELEIIGRCGYVGEHIMEWFKDECGVADSVGGIVILR